MLTSKNCTILFRILRIYAYMTCQRIGNTCYTYMYSCMFACIHRLYPLARMTNVHMHFEYIVCRHSHARPHKLFRIRYRKFIIIVCLCMWLHIRAYCVLMFIENRKSALFFFSLVYSPIFLHYFIPEMELQRNKSTQTRVRNCEANDNA